MEGKIQFPLKDAEELANAALHKIGYDVKQSERIADHLIDSELRGFGIAGLARILSIADRLAGSKPATATKITREAPATAQIDGQDALVRPLFCRATESVIHTCLGIPGCVRSNGACNQEM